MSPQTCVSGKVGATGTDPIFASIQIVSAMPLTYPSDSAPLASLQNVAGFDEISVGQTLRIGAELRDFGEGVGKSGQLGWLTSVAAAQDCAH